MVFLKLATFLGFVCLCLAGEQDVVDLGDSDFEARINEYETALVMFYAPWCGHCKRLKPEYAKAAEDLIRNDPPVYLAKVDCTEAGKETCNKFSVSGYPTLKIFRNGEVSQEYSGPREAPGIVKYMKAQVGPSSKELTSMADFEKFLTVEKDVSVVGFFEKESSLKAAFLKLANKEREKIRFAHSSFSDVLATKGYKDNVVLYRPKHLSNKFEEDFVVFSDSNVDKLHNFITKNYHGIVGHRRADNKQDFQNPLIVAYYIVDYVKNVKGTNYWRNRILKIGSQYKDKFTFAVSSKDEFQHELNEYGIDFVKGDKPTILARNAKNQKFVMKDEFSMEALEQFIKDMLEEKLESYLKSEAIPESNAEPVKVAVAKNFDEIVMDNGKDTLIEFYAPWCGHCKKLAPAYDEVAQKLENEEVSIVKMDATANDVPPTFDVRGFPTLFWVPKNSKDAPVRYEGGREADDFLKYIAKHATKELKGFDRQGNPKQEKTEL
ncbi:PREDICTED: protein disulfide-isomerase A3 [Nicrophorus vespilloides]|uniref:Protein disulfide-isomerase n=1 Tax=Nicrophorus vespilloides TaxID=110193 RepID=A0ABM1N7Q7_NICVS|nr:PREDICTED: protein disulfide-isomerase A3 [Nicrophorus vespilloides]